jgi:predicted PurR-regulated permease PerM
VSGGVRPLVAAAGLVLVTACLYWARVLLIPIAVAVLAAFLLTPVVDAFERRRLGRIGSVVVVVVITLLLLVGAGFVLASQLTTLAHELPKYRVQLRQRVADLRGLSDGAPVRVGQQIAKDIAEAIDRGEPAREGGKAIPVVIEAPSFLAQLPSLLHSATAAGLAIVLMIFVLLEREEIRNRLIRLAGYPRLAITTQALQDAGQRISRYLLMQSIVNGSVGVAFGLGLLVIGVPYAVLWGCLLAVLRFVPYVGAWAAVALPMLLSLALFDGWLASGFVLGLFLALELIAYAVLEPWLFSQSAGVSKVALLVAVAFWTWLWGPVGLILATPLTVCLVVLSRHVPALDFLAVLLADSPVLSTQARYYQRLLANDQDEAADVVEEHAETHGSIAVFDDVLIPALHYARQDRDRERVTEAAARGIVQATAEIMRELDAEEPDTASPAGGSAAGPVDVDPAVRVEVLGFPVRDESDALALEMLRRLLEPTRSTLTVIGPGLLSAEVIEAVRAHGASAVCLGSVTPGGLTRTRYLCKRLRVRFPGLRILVGRWGPNESLEHDRRVLVDAGAAVVGASLAETRMHCMDPELVGLGPAAAVANAAPPRSV